MVVRFRGGLTCTCVVASLPYVEDDMLAQGLIRDRIDVFQWGYNGGGVAASAGTHDAGGCTDSGQFSDAHIAVWRKWGWTMQHRTVAQGFSGPHAHGWPRGCPHLSPGARFQASEWEHKRNGLRGRGPVHGPWPIPGWEAAIERNPMPLSDKDVQRIADAVLNADVIPNEFTGNPKNPTVSLKTALSILGRRTKSATAPEVPPT